MSRRPPIVIALVFLAGCSQATLPYKPEEQPKGAKVSAAYQMLADRLKVEIDTDHRRLEDIFIVRADGTAVRAQTIENAPIVTGPGPTVVSVSAAPRSAAAAGSGRASASRPVGEGPSRIEGHTFATFPLAQVGPPPWRLHLKLAGVAPTTILIGGAPSR